MDKESSFGVLKQLSAIGIGVVAVLYGCGYLVHTVYYRVLGLQVGAQPLTYLTFSGDYLVSIILSAPQLVNIWLYGPRLMERRIWPGILLGAFSLLASTLLARKSESPKLSQLSLTALALFCIFTISSELGVLKTQNVLQPFSPNDLQSAAEALKSESSKSIEERSKIIKETYEEYQRLGANNIGFNEWNHWFNPLNANNQKERTAQYLAYLFLNTLFLSAIALALLLRKAHRYRNLLWAEAAVGFLSIILLLPCVYATLGRVYTFPVVTLRLKSTASEKTMLPNSKQSSQPATVDLLTPSNDLNTHAVFLVFEDETRFVVYDRLNLFQFKSVPRDRVLGITQIYTSTPFADCSLKGGFSPCESKWFSATGYVVDY